MLSFAQALQSGRLIPPEVLSQATSPQEPGGRYGFGFGLDGARALRHYGHNGGAPGIIAELHIYPALGRVVVAMSNLDPPTAETVADYYEQRMPPTR
jgi:D-alanyl-D-alanine carboxypeptidase